MQITPPAATAAATHNPSCRYRNSQHIKLRGNKIYAYKRTVVGGTAMQPCPALPHLPPSLPCPAVTWQEYGRPRHARGRWGGTTQSSMSASTTTTNNPSCRCRCPQLIKGTAGTTHNPSCRCRCRCRNSQHIKLNLIEAQIRTTWS